MRIGFIRNHCLRCGNENPFVPCSMTPLSFVCEGESERVCGGRTFQRYPESGRGRTPLTNFVKPQRIACRTTHVGLVGIPKKTQKS